MTTYECLSGERAFEDVTFNQSIYVIVMVTKWSVVQFSQRTWFLSKCSRAINRTLSYPLVAECAGWEHWKCLKCGLTSTLHLMLLSSQFDSTFGPGECHRYTFVHQLILCWELSLPSRLSALSFPALVSLDESNDQHFCRFFSTFCILKSHLSLEHLFIFVCL